VVHGCATLSPSEETPQLMISREPVTIVAAACSLLCLCADLFPQQPVPATRAVLIQTVPAGAGLRAPDVTTMVVSNPTDSPNQDPAAVAAAAVVTARLQKFKQTQFDRRPSSVIKAWAAPELKPYDPAEEAEKAKEKGGAPSGGTESAPAKEPISPEAVRQMVIEEVGVDPGLPQPGDGKSAVGIAGTSEQQLAEKCQQRELEMLQRDVTLGRWQKVGEFFATFDEKQRKDVYEHFLRVLPNAPPQQDQRIPPNLQEKNSFAFEDAFALAGLAPGGFDKKQVPLLATIVRRALDSGSVLEELIRLFGVECAKPEAEQRIDRRKTALLLSAIGQEIEMGAFLPTAEEAEQKNDREALNLLARYALAQYAKEKRTSFLGVAWRVTQAALAKGEVTDEEKAEALRRAVELAPKVQEDLGPAWLAESFTERPERGMEIIATIGGQVAKGFQEHAQDPSYRSLGLQLQKSAVDALLKVAPQLAEKWRPTLGLLASGWLVEAAWSYQNSQTDSMGPVMQRDEYGNIFWGSMRRGGGGQVQAVEPADLALSQPGPEWAALLDDALQPHFATISAQLYLKVNEGEKAFPYIEKLATVNPRKAKELANEFLRVWTRKANPNRNQTNSYMYMYGFDMRSNGIPLTRSKQERNLAELGSWVERLRQLPIGGVDEKLVTEAFVTAHSQAEVYRLETIERVFGDVSALDPVLLAELLGRMRTNLATVWRRPDVQDNQKTRRSQKETLQEVAEGYSTAMTVAAKAMQKRGPHWALLGVTASLLHDQNNFGKELSRDSRFADARRAAFEMFAKAADLYIAQAGDLRIDEESLRAFDVWFYAALGACDLGAIDEETIVAKSQLPLIKKAILRLPAGSRERHMDMFANALFTRMSAVKPQIKHRYLEAGFSIVGDNPQAAEARKVFEYYEDLLRELRLECVVEGATEIGTLPFGVRVDIVHTQEIERESGGFAKYAQNQNNMNYAYNYGRPLENYRDRFNDAVTAALSEQFEVLSVTWNGEQMASKPSDVPGWRRTPYAWLLLKARGPQVDRLPAIQLDFDFLDTSGYAVLPIGSSAVTVDATHASAAPRPFRDLAVTQILDERKLGEGKVTLEIKATAQGLVPDLDQFLSLETPGFKIDKSDDQGASVAKFADDQDGVQSERTWLLALVPAEEGAQPRNFVFGKPTLEDLKVVYQRYNDADLETVSPEVALSGGLGSGNPTWAWVLVGIAGFVYLLWFFLWTPGGRRIAGPAVMLAMPKHVTPFTVLGLLRQIDAQVRLDAAEKQQLAGAITRIEACHFGRAEDPSLDLKAIAEEWLRRAI
jgi:hypothetical protein